MLNRIPKKSFILLIIILFYFINNIIWFSQDGNQYIGCESIFHLQRAFEIYSQIKNPSPSNHQTGEEKSSWLFQIKQKTASNISSTFAVISAFLANLLNIPFIKIKSLNIFYIFLIILSTYLIGENLGNKKIGLMAMFLVSFYPMIYGISRKFVPEIALIALVSSAYYTLIKTAYFKHTKHSLLLGGIGFLGMIIHPLFIIFICGGLFYYFYKIFRHKDNFLYLRLLNLFVCILIMVLSITINYENFTNLKLAFAENFTEMHITLTTYSKNFVGNADKAKDDLFIFASATDFCPCTQTTERGMNIRCLSFYLCQLFDSTSALFFVTFIMGLCFFLKNKNCSKKMLLFFWIVFPYLILTLLPKKWGRFYCPVLPAIAIITSCGISAINNNRVKKILIISIIIGGLIQFFIYSYFLLPGKPFLCQLKESINAHRPVRTNYNYNAQKIMEGIVKNNIKNNFRIGLFDITTTADRFTELWYNDLTYYFQILLKMHNQTESEINLHWHISSSQLNEYEFAIIIKENNNNLNRKLFNNHTLINKYKLAPANLDVLVYKNRF